MFHEIRLNSSDGLKLYAWIKQPARQPKGVIAHVHGMGEHSRRYDHLAGYWEDHGYVAAGFDLRGHGRSEGKRGHTASYEFLMEDLAIFLDWIAHTCPGLPVTLYGHSMGGNFALNYVIRHRPALAGVVVSAPFIWLAFKPPAWKVRMAEWLIRIAPAMSQNTRLDTRGLSRDAAVVERYETDPLVHGKITLSFFTHVQAAGEALIGRAAELAIPTLVMHGGADTITSLAGSEAFVAASSGRALLKIWEGWFHEVHNEPDWKELAAFVLAWLESRVK